MALSSVMLDSFQDELEKIALSPAAIGALTLGGLGAGYGALSAKPDSYGQKHRLRGALIGGTIGAAMGGIGGEMIGRRYPTSPSSSVNGRTAPITNSNDIPSQTIIQDRAPAPPSPNTSPRVDPAPVASNSAPNVSPPTPAPLPASAPKIPLTVPPQSLIQDADPLEIARSRSRLKRTLAAGALSLGLGTGVGVAASHPVRHAISTMNTAKPAATPALYENLHSFSGR